MGDLLVVRIPLGVVTINLSLVAAAVYLACVYIPTRYFRRAMALHPVLISWGFSVPAFFLVWVIDRKQFTLGVVVQFAMLTLLLNSGLKITHVLWDALAKRYTFIPLRERKPGVRA